MKKYGEKDKEQLRHLGRKIDLKKKNLTEIFASFQTAHILIQSLSTPSYQYIEGLTRMKWVSFLFVFLIKYVCGFSNKLSVVCFRNLEQKVDSSAHHNFWLVIRIPVFMYPSSSTSYS